MTSPDDGIDESEVDESKTREGKTSTEDMGAQAKQLIQITEAMVAAMTKMNLKPNRADRRRGLRRKT